MEEYPITLLYDDQTDVEPDPMPDEPMPRSTLSAADVLGPGGLLAQRVPGYEHRRQQMAMADLVTACIEGEQHAIIEAGTGVGKSYAYLVPAILSGKTTVVTTANKTLQGQLVHKDLPMLQELLSRVGVEFDYAVAKGKANYLCLRKVQRRTDRIPHHARSWTARTDTGDIDEAPFVLEPDVIRDLCAGDDCNPAHCGARQSCYYYAAKRRRFVVDVVVANHALLCQQLRRPYAQILPEAGVLIVDEAHQLESYAMTCESLEVSPWAFRGPAAPWVQQGNDLLKDLASGRLDNGSSDVLIDPRAVYDEGLALAAELSEAAGGLTAQVSTALDPSQASDMQADSVQLLGLAERVEALSSETPSGHVRHVATRRGALVGQLTCFDVSGRLAVLGETYPTVVYTSATLATGPGDFDYFRARNGVARARTLQVGSPFDYSRQALLYVPMTHGMPDPRARREAYDRAVQRQMWLLAQASEGGALLLFTSYNAMHGAANVLAEHLPYPVRRQGEAGKGALIDWLKATPHAVLCATASFWEGVDVPGDALRLVAIDKLPFEAPGPVERARQDAAGSRAFIDLVVPEATLKLKQGFGRLIRSTSDRGVVAILDPRLWTARYGRRIVEALPDAMVATDIDSVRSFYGHAKEVAA